MLIGYKRGQGSIVLRLKIINSSVATGAGLTGLTSASTGLIISTIADNEASATAYTVAGSTVESITTLGTFAAPTATKCRFKEVDATNHKGVYEIQIADARYAVSSAKSLLISISGANNAAETDVVIPLRDLDPYDAVRAGLTALPNAAAEASGGLYTRGTGLGQINQDANGRTDVNVKTWIGGAIPAVNVTGVPIVDDKYLLGTVYSTPATAGIQDINVKNINNQAATAAAGVTFPASIASPTNITAGTITTVTNLTNSPTAGDLTATMKTSVTTAATAATPIAASVTGAVGSVTGLTASDVGAIKAKTDNLPSDPADESLIIAATNSLAALIGTPATSVSADIAAVKAVDDAVKTQTDKLTFTVTNQIDANVIDWKSSIAPAMTGDAYARIGANGVGLTSVRLSTTGVADIWAYVIEGSWTAVMYMRLMAAALFGKLSGAATATVTIRDVDDTKDRMVVTVDADGNRSAFGTRDGT